MNLLARYSRWLHTGWPAGRVERMPAVRPDGSTAVPGVWIAGDLAGLPLLKSALDSGVRSLRAIDGWLGAAPGPAGVPDVLIVGAGPAGMAAALEARRLGRRAEVVEAVAPFATLAAFPRAKPIFTYPLEHTPAGALQVRATVKEDLLEELRAQVEGAGIAVTRGRAERVERAAGRMRVRLDDGRALEARAVLVAIGRSGDFRRLGVPGEQLDHVTHRLHDPAAFAGRDVVVVGGGDSAAETATALAEAGARVTHVHRGPDLARARTENAARVEALAAERRLSLRLGSEVRAVHPTHVTVGPVGGGPADEVRAETVFAMLGREAPLGFLRRSGVRIAGEVGAAGWMAAALLVLAMALMLDWKSSGFLEGALWSRWPWPADLGARLAGLGGAWAAWCADRSTPLGTLAVSMQSRSFYYTLAYTLVVGVFGWRRIRARRTPYVTCQTVALFVIQALPLFLLPELLLPWAGYRGAFDHGVGRAFADALFEPYVSAADLAAHHWPAWGHPRAYWRAYGFMLAWPLNVYNVFTSEPRWAWLAIGALQTLVLIPLAVLRWGKGAYCGWVCSCGALAETLGDRLRTRMPHGPGPKRLELVGQWVLAAAVALLVLRVAAWALPGSGLGRVFDLLAAGRDPSGRLVSPFAYQWLVDVLIAGALGVGLYALASGRVWCRFACPLAAWMHVVARSSRFAIVAEKKKCISCNVCTSVCHQGIDVMAFAQRGRPMQDPQCVRCSACVQGCPTGVLRFGRVDPAGRVIALDTLRATAPLAAIRAKTLGDARPSD